MIQYICDMCGEIANENFTAFSKFPRRVTEYVYSGDTKLAGFTKYGFAETILCNKCCHKIADILIIDKE